MGSSVSSSPEQNKLNGGVTPRNYVPISGPPQYDLKWCSTDSDITELEEERLRLLATQIVDQDQSDSSKKSSIIEEEPQRSSSFIQIKESSEPDIGKPSVVSSGLKDLEVASPFVSKTSTPQPSLRWSSLPRPSAVTKASDGRRSSLPRPSAVTKASDSRRSSLPRPSAVTKASEGRRSSLPRPSAVTKASEGRQSSLSRPSLSAPRPSSGLPSSLSRPTTPVARPSDRQSSLSRPTPPVARPSSRQSSLPKPTPPVVRPSGRSSSGKPLTPITSVSNVPSDPRYQEPRKSFARKSNSISANEPRTTSVEPILEEDFIESSVLPEEIQEEQKTVAQEQTEPIIQPEETTEDVRITKVDEEEPEASTLFQTISDSDPKIREDSETKSLSIPKSLHKSSSDRGKPRRTSERWTSERVSSAPSQPRKSEKSLRSAIIESLNPECLKPEECKLHRCPRQVKFSKRIGYGDRSRYPQLRDCGTVSGEPYPYDNEDDDSDDGYECLCTDEEYDLADDGFAYSVEEEIHECVCNNYVEQQAYAKGMPDYQRYSREQPEKDANHGRKPADGGNMRECCRPCYPNRTVSLKHNNTHLGCRCGQANSGNRYNSESYVGYRSGQKNPAYSKSTPNHLEERDSFQNFGSYENHQQRKSSPRSQQRKKVSARQYPSVYDSRGGSDRPHIPLPPPPQQFRSEEPLSISQQLAPQHRESRISRDLSRTSGNLDDSAPLEDDKKMYNHNTNRGIVANKKPFGNNRQFPPVTKVLKPYLYAESGGSCSTCSNNCSGYDHCPMHHSCRCQCHCSDDTYCSQDQSDEQMSYCSDSSNSECMNLAYQRTGDYPELMDELENTLSHRNRLRVQKTMQRFEMLSRQNKNLEKPIFEDEESVRQMNMHRDNTNECRCQHCEDKYRRENFTRSEALSKRANYQATPFPRNSGYVEKVARYMDPNLNNRRDHRKKLDNGHDTAATLSNSTGSWQKDVRKNEWVKVDTDQQGNVQNQYDFESSYPPLPPRPISEHRYDRRNYCRENVCTCGKCMRRR